MNWLLRLFALAKMVSVYGSDFPVGIFLGNLKTRLTAKPYIIIQIPQQGEPLFQGHLRNA